MYGWLGDVVTLAFAVGSQPGIRHLGFLSKMMKDECSATRRDAT
jgi:hypothetical protein